MTRIDDREIRRKVIAELEYDPDIDSHPSIDASTIGVAVRDAVVTLSGCVASHRQKEMAERAAKRVSGVRGLADGLTINVPGATERSDADIARAAISGLRLDADVPTDRIQVTVGNGWLVLEGEVDTEDQKRAAGQVARSLTAVRGITNWIAVKPRPGAAAAKTSTAHADRTQ